MPGLLNAATRLFGAAALLCVWTANLAHAEDKPLVTVFEAAKIITMEPSLPTARFVAVADGTILGTADSLAELAPWTDGRTVSIDRRFSKDFLMPGLIDPHVHPMQAAVIINIPYIAPDEWTLPSGFFPAARSAGEYRRLLRAQLSKAADGPFITWGHHELFHGSIDRAELDSIAGDRPVIIWQRSFHDVIMNSAALRHFGINDRGQFDALLEKARAEPAHGNYDKGVFSETALVAALGILRPLLLSPEKLTAGFATLQKMMLRSGVTTVSDMGTGIFAPFDLEAGLIRQNFEKPDNPSRVMLMPIALQVPAGTDLDAWYADISKQYSSRHIRVDRRIKMLVDGAFFAQNMRMNAPGYIDGHEGKWITPPDVAQAQFQRFWDAGFDLHIHVNGDEGLDAVLAGLAKLDQKRDQTITLEHLGYSTEAQNRRIAKMGLMVSAQPNYVRVLADIYAAHGLGADRAAVMNRLGSLEKKNVTLGLHSDFNMAPINPLYLAWIAANRITLDGNVKAPEERLSLDKALRAITIEAAQVIGMDDIVGSIAAGKKADFAVLDRDPYLGGAPKLRDVKVKGVVFEGRVYPVE
jgi:predicted amidohydrolase YtcJ